MSEAQARERAVSTWHGVPGLVKVGVCDPAEPYRPPTRPRLLDQVRAAIRARHYSYRTEEAYVAWIRRFIFFHQKRHRAEMGPGEITQFLTSLAVQRHVSASTQNQALASLLFLYQHVLGRDPGWLDGIVRAKRPERLPVVLTWSEVAGLLARMRGVPCAAWTYARPGFQGPRGRCWLKTGVPHPVDNQNTVSGVKFRLPSVPIDPGTNLVPAPE